MKIIIFGLLLGPTFVNAQTISSDELTQKVAQVNNLSENTELACPNELPSTDEIVVMFDGMKGFCPKTAAFELPLWSDANHYSLAREVFEYGKRRETVGEADEGPPDAIDLPTIWATEAKEKSFFHGCYLIDAIKTLFSAAKTKKPVLYYSHRGQKEAVECITSLQKKAELSNRKLSVSFLGYSLGADSVVRVSKTLWDAGISTRRVVTVDPVGRWLRALNTTVFNKNDSKFFTMPSYVQGGWFNYYQSEDKESLTISGVKLFGIRGSQVEGATVNEKLSMVGEKSFSAYLPPENFPHLKILYHKDVVASLLQLFELKNAE